MKKLSVVVCTLVWIIRGFFLINHGNTHHIFIDWRLLLFLLFLFAYSFQIYIALFQCLSIFYPNMLSFLLYYVMLHVDAGGNPARHCHLVPGAHLVQYARYGKNSFRFAASALWNSLPDHFRIENSFSQFKSLLQSWNGSKCRCSACR